MESFLANRFRLPSDRLTRDHTIGSLRAAGRHDLAIRVDRLYRGADQSGRGLVEEQKQEARAIVSEICERRFRTRPQANVSQLGSTTTMFLLTILAGSLLQASSIQAASLQLTAEQQQQLLAEGVAVFESATENPDRIEANDQFHEAADKFQLLVDAGVENDRLFFNLAEASNRIDQIGQAIANYRRALRLDPANALYHERLAEAEISAGIGVAGRESLLERARRINDWVLRWISPMQMLVGFTIAWVAFWITLSSRVLGLAKSWKPLAGLMLVVASLCGGSYLLRVRDFTRDDCAVLVSSSVSLREGDGNEFAEVSKLNDRGRARGSDPGATRGLAPHRHRQRPARLDPSTRRRCDLTSDRINCPHTSTTRQRVCPTLQARRASLDVAPNRWETRLIQ